ncbi:hypothetical protein CHBEV_153 [Choristoneura biennis entomopoxvirus]|uniref:Uncharacterized protein n=1 Tax=Choristoneura biennis entomopoxvirus TaxID=10288 RepID=A0A916KPL4_CBEPV|nr:hypothetical protein CHBEV_153 [Choristoneura biennis entomopoxvirus]CCU55721.1 hypothetical protein CHBEV_153 [Choristoneura biennis entomopoxvirus]
MDENNNYFCIKAYIDSFNYNVLLIKENNKYLLIKHKVTDNIKNHNNYKIIAEINDVFENVYDDLLLSLRRKGILKNNIIIKFGNLYNINYLVNKMNTINKNLNNATIVTPF